LSRVISMLEKYYSSNYRLQLWCYGD